MKKSTYIYRGFERFWHWSQALLILFLAFTGFEIHGTYSLMGFENVVRWHNIAAWAFIILIIFAIFWHFVTGEWKQYIPTTHYIKAQFEYYISGIFRGAPHPTHKTVYNKFNPIQRLIYLGLKMVILPLQVITGFIYMFYVYPDNPIQVGGLGITALVHTAMAFVLIAFVIAHVYLTTTGDTPLSSIRAMITGWEVIDMDEKEEREKHLQQAVDDSVAGYYRIDSEGILRDVNEAWLRMYNCKDRNKVIGKHFSITRNEKNLAEMEELVNKVLQKGEMITGYPVMRKTFDGKAGKHLLSANPVLEDGKITGMEGFILDIHDRDELMEHMYYAVRNSGAGYYRLDSDGKIMDVNEAWLKLYKYDHKDEVVGRHFSITRKSKDLNDLKGIFDSVMNGESVSGKLITRRCKDNSKGKHILSASPFYIGHKVMGMEGFILDVSQLYEKIKS